MLSMLLTTTSARCWSIIGNRLSSNAKVSLAVLAPETETTPSFDQLRERHEAWTTSLSFHSWVLYILRTCHRSALAGTEIYVNVVWDLVCVFPWILRQQHALQLVANEKQNVAQDDWWNHWQDRMQTPYHNQPGQSISTQPDSKA